MTQNESHTAIDGIEPVVLLPEVLKIAQCSRATMYRWLKAKKFPPPISNWPMGGLAWRRSDLVEFIGGNVATPVSN